MTKSDKAVRLNRVRTPETLTNGDERQSTFIKSHGGKRPGAGRPLGSVNKISRPLREAAAMESEACLETLVHLRDHGESEQVRLAAATAILDRGHGRPSQQIGVTQQGPKTIIVDRFGLLKNTAGEPMALPGSDAIEPYNNG